MVRKYDLLFSDTRYGTHEFGFLLRDLKRADADDEDRAYEQYVRKYYFSRQKFTSVRCHDGMLTIEESEKRP